ncbi:EamA family transporter [Amycolatopsis suaedae]|uniref:EamA family transporter n=1 Tax=Amycolatopsis suaedae TaxID=2510978 RepID=A0A4Q7J1P7_9PSEU|nr:EamA family transporter [Amycolatopsis suaedae]RZQ60502.1 EamA family transporter [Amycolatopsis suaedae]
MLPAPLLVLAAAVSTQTGQALGKGLFDSAGPLGVVALRLGFAALVLLAVHRPRLPAPGQRLAVAGLGLAVAGMNLVYPAMWWLPVGVASTVQLLGPLTVALLGSRRPADLAAVGAAGAGVWLVNDPAGSSSTLPWQGLLLAGLSAASMGAYVVLARRVAAESGGGGLALAVAIAAVLAVPAGAAGDGTALLAPAVLLAGAVVAVVSAVLPYTLEQAALRRLSAATVGVLLAAEPAVAGVAGLLVLDERLGWPQWLGIGCVSAATAVVAARSTRARDGIQSGHDNRLRRARRVFLR